MSSDGESIGVLAPEQQAWVLRDTALRARAAQIAAKHGRNADDIYRTLLNMQRSPAERLALGLKHARLHPKFR